jgi:hypothetical protein
MALSHIPHTHRRRLRLGARGEDVLHQRWREQPSAPLDPRLQRLLPF